MDIDSNSWHSAPRLPEITEKRQLIASAQNAAEKLLKKILDGVQLIRVELEKEEPENSLPYYFSEPVQSEPVTSPPKALTPLTSYDEIQEWFEIQETRCTEVHERSQFQAWRYRFNAGTIESILKKLPPRTVQSSQIEEQQLEQRQQTPTLRHRHLRHRHRRGMVSRLINSIVYRLPKRPRVVYSALARKDMS